MAAALSTAAASLTTAARDPSVEAPAIASAARDAFGAAAAWAARRARLDGSGDLEGVAAVGRALGRVVAEEGVGSVVSLAAAASLASLERRVARRLGGVRLLFG